MICDFRSDTVTKPTEPMRQAMYAADVGDDVYDEDPTVNRLQKVMAERFGMEDGLFVTSGTQGNLLSLLAHCDRGDEYIVGQVAHTYKYEGGGGAVLGSIQPQPLDFEDDATIDLELARRVIKPVNDHFARTKLFCLENTQAGRALPMKYLSEAYQFVRANGLGYHLDGARIYNAAVFHGVDAAEISQNFDTISCCFSKGLGAPMGSVICGSRDLVRRAKRWRKLVGGGLRQAGVVAAAALYAVEHHVERLAEDHANAKWIAENLRQIEEIKVDFQASQTNMVFVYVRDGQVSQLVEFLKDQGVVITGNVPIRLVTHMDVNREAAMRLVNGFKEFFTQ